MMVGDFFFTCKHFKLALLFESEFTEENIQNVLN